MYSSHVFAAVGAERRRSLHRQTAADVAITVVDEWQGNGVGSELLRQLTDLAGCRGVRRFTALVSADNMRMRRMLGRIAGDVELVGRDADTISYEIAVQRPLRPCA